MKPGVYGFLIFMVFSFAACGGGGGGGSSAGGGAGTPSGGGVAVVPIGTPTSAPTATPAATPTAVALSVSGTAQEYTTGVALSGFTVTVGQVPNAATCLAGESATSMPCGVPASPLPTVTTSATGAFSLAVPAAGTYMLTIGKDATYATLHRTIVVAAATPLALGTVKIAALTTDEQAWVVDLNMQRATVSVPTSFGNLIVDEYAEEQARKWALDTAAGTTAFTDAAYEPYQSAYSADIGSMYAAAGVLSLNLLGQTSAYLGADASWMNEKANCPSGNWQTCTFAQDTGHYINISETDTVWTGVGESAASPSSGYTYYDAMLIENLGSNGPALVRRSK